MLSLLLSLLLALVQVVFCPDLACQFLAADRAGSGSAPVPQAPHEPASFDVALALLGQAAIETVFSGVVHVGDVPAGEPSSIARHC